MNRLPEALMLKDVGCQGPGSHAHGRSRAARGLAAAVQNSMAGANVARKKMERG